MGWNITEGMDDKVRSQLDVLKMLINALRNRGYSDRSSEVVSAMRCNCLINRADGAFAPFVATWSKLVTQRTGRTVTIVENLEQLSGFVGILIDEHGLLERPMHTPTVVVFDQWLALMPDQQWRLYKRGTPNALLSLYQEHAEKGRLCNLNYNPDAIARAKALGAFKNDK